MMFQNIFKGFISNYFNTYKSIVEDIVELNKLKNELQHTEIDNSIIDYQINKDVEDLVAIRNTLNAYGYDIINPVDGEPFIIRRSFYES